VYIAHNRHMLAYAAMTSGQRDLAIKHIRAMVAEMPADFSKKTRCTRKASWRCRWK